VASNAIRIPGTGCPVATPDEGKEAHTIPEPVRLPLALTERAAALENPALFVTVLVETALVLN
jgi:hypothetical protein